MRQLSFRVSERPTQKFEITRCKFNLDRNLSKLFPLPFTLSEYLKNISNLNRFRAELQCFLLQSVQDRKRIRCLKTRNIFAKERYNNGNAQVEKFRLSRTNNRDKYAHLCIHARTPAFLRGEEEKANRVYIFHHLFFIVQNDSLVLLSCRVIQLLGDRQSRPSLIAKSRAVRYRL